MKSTLLIIENLTVSYGDHRVLDRLCLSLEAGRVHGLVGLNGSGKTTLLNAIAGFKKPDGGSINLGLHAVNIPAEREKPLHPLSETTNKTSHSISGQPENTPNPLSEPGDTSPGASPERGGVDPDASQERGGKALNPSFEVPTGKPAGKHLNRSLFSFLETENFFYSKITGREYLELFKIPDHSKTIDAWNGIFDLPLDELIDGYSSGMKKKLALLGVLRQMKPLIILDEPFNGLDIESTRLLSMIITSLREQHHTVIVTSHILGSLTGICDLIHYLKGGKILFSKEPGQFGSLEEEIFSEVDREHEIRLRSLLG